MEYRETSEDGVTTCYEVTSVIAGPHVSHRNQLLEILESPVFGKMLFIDGEGQSSQFDEFIYHEALVHPAMTAFGTPRRVLILGGGEGATLREVLKYDSVEQAVMVEWDETMVAMARKHLPTWHKGSFDDPRAQVIFDDVRAWLREVNNRFDVILVDLPDSFVIDNIAPLLKNVMHDKTVLTLQAGPCNILHANRLMKLCDDLRQYIDVLGVYGTPHIPFFQSPWAFVTSHFPDSEPSVPTALFQASSFEKLCHYADDVFN